MNIIKTTLIFAAGAATGAVAAYIFTKRKYKNLEERMEAIQDNMVAKAEHKKIVKKEYNFDNGAKMKMTIENPRWSVPPKPSLKEATRQLIDSTKNLVEPRIIDIEEFSSDDTYDKITISYYEGDAVFVDEIGEMMMDAPEMLGLLAMGHMADTDIDILYVRNERLKIDYEIARCVGKYSVEVLGMDDPDEEEPVPAKPKKVRRKKADVQDERDDD